MSMQESVQEFHEKFGAPVALEPTLIPKERAILRIRLIQEELQEYADAVDSGDLVEIADALGDLLVVVFGTAVEHGINMGPVFSHIMESNMSKLGEDGKPILREDGKILKGPGYFAPDIAPILKRMEL